MTGPAWLVVIGCGLCLLLTIGMAVALTLIGANRKALHHENRKLIDRLNYAEVEIKRLTPQRKHTKHTIPTVPVSKDGYLIREEEYV